MKLKELIGEELYVAGPFMLAALLFIAGVIALGSKIFDPCA